jgi:hypothetical protein
VSRVAPWSMVRSKFATACRALRERQGVDSRLLLLVGRGFPTPTRTIERMAWLKELPLGFRLYFWFWTLFVPAGVALLFAGAVVPGLVLLGLFVVDQAVFVPLVVARRQKQKRARQSGKRSYPVHPGGPDR